MFFFLFYMYMGKNVPMAFKEFYIFFFVVIFLQCIYLTFSFLAKVIFFFVVIFLIIPQWLL